MQVKNIDKKDHCIVHLNHQKKYVDQYWATVNAYIFNHSFFQIKRPYRRIVTSVSRRITWSTYSSVISYIEQITVVLWQSAIQSKCRLLPIRLSKRDFKALNSHHCVKCHIPITQLFSLRIQYSRTFDVYIDHSMIKKIANSFSHLNELQKSI